MENLVKGFVVTRQIVDAIEADISARAGIGSEWDMFDEGIKEEIKNTWTSIIDPILKEFLKERIPTYKAICYPPPKS